MQVRSKKRAPKWKGEPQREPAQPYTFSAPTRGWVLNESLVNVQPGGARILDNWICTTRGARMRGGCLELVNVTDPVKSLFTYKSTAESLFIASADTIYTSAGASAVGSLTSGDFSALQFGAAGGDYLYAVNGADEAQLFNGTSWQAVNAASSPISITGVTTSDLSQVWSFGSRIWFVEKNSLSVWYLPTSSVGGAATELDLSAVFTLGGSMLFGAKWSLDAGDGMDDKCVFVTTEGEVAVYEGTDPSSDTTWRKVGLYKMPRPLGKRAHVQAGGDLLIATRSGLIPISAVLRYDLAALEQYAVSRPIEPYWQNRAEALTSTWDVVKSPDTECLIVSQPDTTGANQTGLLSNLTTGAWSRATGWDVQCLAVYDGATYFGALDGGVYRLDTGGSDNGSTYTASFLGLFEAMGVYGAQKTVRQLRALFESGTAFQAKIGALADYLEVLPTPPATVAQDAADVWDTGEWDTAQWDAGFETRVNSTWTPAGVTGSVIAPYVMISSSGTVKPVIDLVSIDAQFHVGAMVT